MTKTKSSPDIRNIVWNESYGYGVIDRIENAVSKKIYSVKFRDKEGPYTRWLRRNEFMVMLRPVYSEKEK
jgi:hypothetical protein